MRMAAGRGGRHNPFAFERSRFAAIGRINEQNLLRVARKIGYLGRQLLRSDDVNFIVQHFAGKFARDVPAQPVIGTERIANANDEDPGHFPEMP